MKLHRYLGVLATMAFLAPFQVALAQQDCDELAEHVPAAAVAGDTLLARPVGLVSLGIGTVLYVITLPFSVTSGSEGLVREKLIEDPAEFTFSRCLGDFRIYRHRNIKPLSERK